MWMGTCDGVGGGGESQIGVVSAEQAEGSVPAEGNREWVGAGEVGSRQVCAKRVEELAASSLADGGARVEGAGDAVEGEEAWGDLLEGCP